MKRAAQLASLLLPALGLAFLPPARAQGEPAGPIHPSAAARQKQQSKPPLPVPPNQKPLRIRVNLVTLPVAVTTNAGVPILSLTKKDFQVFDGGVQQQITKFDVGGDPLSMVLVLETSARVAPLLPAVQKTGIIFTQMVMGDTSEAAVIGYNGEVDLLRPMTTDASAVLTTIEHIRASSPGARLYDAIYRAENILEMEPRERRRIILVVGEKNDVGSQTKLGADLRRAQLANISIYTIGLSTTAAEFRKKPEATPTPSVSPPGTYPVPPTPGTAQTPDAMNEAMGANGGSLLPVIVWLVEHAENVVGRNSLKIMAQGTGGLHLATFKDRSIEKAMSEIGNDVHGDYLLAYKPSGNQPYGYHQIEVRVMVAHVKVRTRPGYYLAPPAD